VPERPGHAPHLEREHAVYGKSEYARLAAISVAHLYNLRRRPRYRQCLLPCARTRATQAAIGERRKPMPQGQPRYVRLDTEHQGDPQNKDRGVYHINAVDEVTQWQIAAAAPRISEGLSAARNTQEPGDDPQN
jgi:hypothetical protein